MLKSKMPEYRVWNAMKHRCFSKKDISFKYYGARGITVCMRWMKFEAFVFDMGLKPSLKHSLDRIDSNENYEPSNCRWATMKEQANNKRNSVKHFGFGKLMTASEWSDKIGIPLKRIYRELKLGFSIEHISHSEPVQIQRPKGNIKSRRYLDWSLQDSELSAIHNLSFETIRQTRRQYKKQRKYLVSKRLISFHTNQNRRKNTATIAKIMSISSKIESFLFSGK